MSKIIIILDLNEKRQPNDFVEKIQLQSIRLENIKSTSSLLPSKKKVNKKRSDPNWKIFKAIKCVIKVKSVKVGGEQKENCRFFPRKPFAKGVNESRD